MIFEPVILILTGIAALIAQMIYFLLDDREANGTARDRRLKRNWHWAGGAIHIWMGYAVGRMFGWHWAPVTGALMWYFFDGFINTYALRREWWYIGTTAAIDRIQQWAAAQIHIDARLFSACLKHAVLILSLLFLISRL